MIGKSLGRYAIESKLGEGGMGVVFKARDTQLERAVAIKILPPGKVADPDRKRRFVQEAKAASALNHPHIITIYDIGSDGDTDFIVMEYLAGTTLDHLVPAQGLPLKRALAFGIAIADALAKAHEAGIIHRDLKPSNVMITDAGGVKVLDFGVAKLLEAAEASGETRTVAAATEEGTTIGTPGYMSPEQAEGRRLDGRSDIFGFGAVLYEMVTGRKAFSGDSRLSVLAKILNEEPAPPSRFTAAVPPELEKTILRCLRKDPARRYQTMADLKVALDDLVIESSGTAPSPVPVRAPWSLRRWALVAALPIIGVGAVYFAAQSWRTPVTSEPLRAVPLTSLSGVVRSPSFSPDGDHVVFSWTGARQDNPDVYVQQIGAGSPLRLTTDPANDYSPSWSPDGRTIAFLRRDPSGVRSELRLVPPLGGPERKVADLEPRVALFRAMSLSWCPDSTCVLVVDSPGKGESDAVFAVALDTGEKRQVTHPKGLVADSDPTISPDGRSLVFRRDGTPFSGQFHRLSLKGGAVPDGEAVRLTETLNAGKPAWTPDSRAILFGSRGALWRLDALKGGAPTRLPFVGQDGVSPVVSRAPDGSQRMVYVHSFADGNLWRVDTSTAGAPASSPPVSAIASTRNDHIPNLSPDGRRVVFMSNRSGEHEVWVAGLDGSDAIQVTSLGVNPGFPRWSPDGSQIVFHGDPQGRADVLLVPASGGKVRIVTAATPGGAFPSFSRDGQWIYISAGCGEAQCIVRMPASGGVAVPVTKNPGAIAIESVDGRDLYYIEAADRPSPVWRVPLAGGTPVKVLEGVVLAAFDVVERGLYYIDRVSGEAGGFFTDRPGGETRLQFFDFATRQSTTVARNLGVVGPGLSASRDGRTVFYSRVDSAVDELMLVENFR
jgi:eukaryotic-like serine/threonine-protein kinase